MKECRRKRKGQVDQQMPPFAGCIQIRLSLLSAVASFSLIFALAFASPAWAAPETASFGAYEPNLQPNGIELTTLELALPPSAPDLQAKIEECQVCHQPSGQGFHGVPPVPRLAGQQIEYIVNQLRAFIEHRRVHPIMSNVAQFLSPAMQRSLAEHFRGLNPKPIGGAPRELEAAGKKIYEEGAPDAGVPPCAFCHGPQAKGNGPFPRLAGQLHDYILNKLENWNQERGQDPAKQDTSAIMQPIAHSLTKAQMEAVAAYLNYLE
jgi:cytochrome c553